MVLGFFFTSSRRCGMLLVVFLGHFVISASSAPAFAPGFTPSLRRLSTSPALSGLVMSNDIRGQRGQRLPMKTRPHRSTLSRVSGCEPSAATTTLDRRVQEEMSEESLFDNNSRGGDPIAVLFYNFVTIQLLLIVLIGQLQVIIFSHPDETD
jgi:hypothetical protein